MPPVISSELRSFIDVTTLLTTVLTTSGMVATVAATVDSTATVALEVTDVAVGIGAGVVIDPMVASEVVAFSAANMVDDSMVVVVGASVEVNSAVAKAVALLSIDDVVVN